MLFKCVLKRGSEWKIYIWTIEGGGSMRLQKITYEGAS
jgi:hypothetical protein